MTAHAPFRPCAADPKDVSLGILLAYSASISAYWVIIISIQIPHYITYLKKELSWSDIPLRFLPRFPAPFYNETPLRACAHSVLIPFLPPRFCPHDSTILSSSSLIVTWLNPSVSFRSHLTWLISTLAITSFSICFLSPRSSGFPFPSSFSVSALVYFGCFCGSICLFLVASYCLRPLNISASWSQFLEIFCSYLHSLPGWLPSFHGFQHHKYISVIHGFITFRSDFSPGLQMPMAHNVCSKPAFGCRDTSNQHKQNWAFSLPLLPLLQSFGSQLMAFRPLVFQAKAFGVLLTSLLVSHSTHVASGDLLLLQPRSEPSSSLAWITPITSYLVLVPLLLPLLDSNPIKM